MESQGEHGRGRGAGQGRGPTEGDPGFVQSHHRGDVGSTQQEGKRQIQQIQTCGQRQTGAGGATGHETANRQGRQSVVRQLRSHGT